MDDPALPEPEHVHALDGLTRLNRASRAAATLWHAISPLAGDASRPLEILDVATGAGDIPVALLQRAASQKIPLHVCACDISPAALAHAATLARAARVSIRLFQADVVAAAALQPCDLAICSLFLHHLSETQAVDLLRKMAEAARIGILVSDLRRSRAGLWLAVAATRLLTHSPIVHFDGPQSVRNAYTIAEVRELARRAGLHGATLTRCFPFRYLLEWRR